MGFEIAEDLGWRTPDHVVAPMAGGSLIGKISKAFQEFAQLGLIEGPVTTKMHGAQATGCNPISHAVKSDALKVRPVRNPKPGQRYWVRVEKAGRTQYTEVDYSAYMADLDAV